jgi:hypothetical protein
MRIWSAHSLHHPRVEAAKGGHELTFASAVAGVNFRSATSNVGVALSSRRLWHLVPAPLPAPTRKRVLLASDSSNLIKRRVPPEVGRGGHEMIRLIAVAFALALATSAQPCLSHSLTSRTAWSRKSVRTVARVCVGIMRSVAARPHPPVATSAAESLPATKNRRSPTVHTRSRTLISHARHNRSGIIREVLEPSLGKIRLSERSLS